MPKHKLLDDDDGDGDGQPKLVVNKAFAARFEHNKRREELHRLQEKNPLLAARLAREAAASVRTAGMNAGINGNANSGSESSSSSSSSDDDEDDEDDDTDKVLETLVRIKRHDPALYQQDTVLFDKAEDDHAAKNTEDDGPGGKRGSKERPQYLRTVLARQAIEAGGADDSDSDDSRAMGVPHPSSYAAEQDELKKAFLSAAAEAEGGTAARGLGSSADGDGALLKVKRRAASTQDGGGDGGERKVNQLLEEYFGADKQLDEADAFLKSYLAQKAWKQDADSSRGGGVAGGIDNDSSSEDGGGDADDDDEAFLENLDRFEAAYNFRYEEPGAARIQSHPRVIDDSVRRRDDRRKKAREAKAARKAAEREAREAEVRRLKNLKKKEIQDMLARVQAEAGIKSAALAEEGAAGAASGSGGISTLLDELLEGEFDPEEYDRRMAAAFDETYYEGEEEQPDELFGDGEEELAPEADVLASAEMDAPAVSGQQVSFAALRRSMQARAREGGDDDEDDDGSEGDADDGQAAVAAAAERRSALQRLLEEYYRLDCEDTIGDLSCRFRYREVPAERYGLTDEDILTLDDKQLNQIVGLKLLAPYRDGKRVRPNYKALQSIKGEAAAAEAARQRQRERAAMKKAARKEQQGAGGRRGGNSDDGALALEQQQQQQQQRQKQQHGQKRSYTHGNQGGGKQHQHQQQRQQKHNMPQKPLTQLSAEERQAARTASYAKLTLRPGKEAATQQQQGGKMEQQQQQHQPPAKRQKTSAEQTQQTGRLSAVKIDAPLTKAQKKNLLRSLKRKERHGQQQQQQPA